jgi:hypothetical protein
VKSILFKLVSWIGNNKLILLLTLVAFVILGYPLIAYGIDKTFFLGIDPDVIYTTNALLYIKAGIITYMDHPGTPTIVLLSYSFIPLRLVSKYGLHKGFIQWSFDNYTFLTYYLRIFQLVISSTGLLIFLSAIKRFTKSKLLTIVAFCLAFSFAGTLMALSIVPENFTFFLTAVWLVVFIRFVKTRRYLCGAILAAISGFVLANKFTGLFLVIISIFLAFYISKAKLYRKLLLFGINIIIAIGMFILGIRPIIGGLKNIINWVITLFYHANIHGTGVNSIFDWGAYTYSLSLIVKYQAVTVVFIILTVFLGVYLLVEKKLKVRDPIIFVMFTSLAGVLVFAKYPLVYYQYVNIFLLVFCATYFLSKLEIKLIQILLPIAIVLFLSTSMGYISNTSKQLTMKRKDTVRSVLNIWTPFWAADVFKDELMTTSDTKP